MAQAFLAYLDAGKPDRFLGPIADHFRDTPVRHVTGEVIRQAARKLYPGANPATWNRQVIKPAQAAINHAAELGLCPRISVKRFPETPEEKTPADLAWINDFASQATADRLPQLAALALFMFGTGARVGEACALTWADVDLSEATATIRMAKPTPWVRTAHLPPRVVAALANLPTNRNPADLVFGYAGRGSVTKVWNNVSARAKIAALTPHCCRHGFATTMLRAGFDVKTVAKRGGWKDAATVLRIYAHALEDATVTDRLFDTEPAHKSGAKSASTEKRKGNRA
ncbi:hypothetical protein GCM10011392_38790 [Wenxinia marina]|uniref:Site-specific recombinase XerD n=2 Tax=Wenxinia TaxID=653686 RepID=A0A0D0QEJ5_9RHOB|nr:Site-specific recombinase XerD [Wenxinia marina DSM 24838]GGL80427.1 hypothetical protein GCM10011392_38790 [Wenxinia marina]